MPPKPKSNRDRPTAKQGNKISKSVPVAILDKVPDSQSGDDVEKKDKFPWDKAHGSSSLSPVQILIKCLQDDPLLYSHITGSNEGLSRAKQGKQKLARTQPIVDALRAEGYIRTAQHVVKKLTQLNNKWRECKNWKENTGQGIMDNYRVAYDIGPDAAESMLDDEIVKTKFTHFIELDPIFSDRSTSPRGVSESCPPAAIIQQNRFVNNVLE